MRPIRRQRGFIAVLYAAFVVAALLGMVAAVTAKMRSDGVLTRALGNAAEEADQIDKLTDASEKLRQWYELHAWSVDSDAGKPDVATILAEIGVDLRSAKAAFDVTPRLTQDGVGYHVFALWFDVPGATGTGLNQVTGEFNRGTIGGIAASPQYVLVSGFPIQARKERETRYRMAKITDALVNYFSLRAHGHDDPDGDVDTNWFRDTGCSTTSLALPCFDVDTDIGSTTLSAALGFPSETMRNAWHPDGVTMVNNLDASGPPYKMRVTATTPWNSPIELYAVSN